MAKLLSNTRIYGTGTVDTQLLVRGFLPSHSTSTGALQVSGGIGVSGGGFFGGTVTATNFVGSVSGASGSLAGGTAGQLVYQVSPGVTGFHGPGTAGQILVSNGTSGPLYTNTGSIYVGDANTATNIRGGSAGQFIYQTAPGITAFINTGSMYVGRSTLADNVAGGLAGQFLYQSSPNVTAFINTSSMYVGRATIADSVAGGTGFINTVQQTQNASFYLTFVDSNNAAATAENVFTTSSFVVNPGTGNVGIGTASPATTLHVSSLGVAKIRISADTDNITEADIGGLEITQDGGVTTSYFGFDDTNNLVLGVNSTTSPNIYIGTRNDGTTFVTSGDSKITILNNGNVGVGVNPSYKLDVDGVVQGRQGLRTGLGYNSYISDRLQFAASTGYSHHQFKQVDPGSGVTRLDLRRYTGSGDGFDSGEMVTFLNNGNVGIGVTNPGRKLQVAGDITINTVYKDFQSYSGSSNNLTRTWDGVLVAGSDNLGAETYTVIETTVPQDSYMMGGFTIDWFESYSSTNAKTSIQLGGYWNAESNGGFIGWEYTSLNPNITPTIQVGRKTSNGNTVFILSHFNASYPIIVARDLWLGYSTGSDTYGTGWAILQTSSLANYTNLDPVTARVPLSGSSINGTTNYVAKFTSSSSLGNSQIFDNGTNVGVGTASPYSKLDVNFQAAFNPTTPGTTPYGIFLSGQSTPDYATGITFSAGSASAGAAHAGIYSQGSGSYGTKMYFATTDSYATGAQTRMMINHSGLVGINTQDFSYTASDNSPLVGAFTNNRLFLNGSIQLIGNNDAIVFGRGTSSFFKDEEIGFGWGGGWFMTDSTYLRVRNGASVQLYTPGIIRADGDMRAPIYYDQNNTSYYADPASTSAFAGLRIYSSFDTSTSDVYANMRVVRNNGGYANDGMYIGYGNAGTGVTRLFGGGATSGELQKFSTYTFEPGSFRAPIFYDSDNTGYYTDPASVSRMSGIGLGESYYTHSYPGVLQLGSNGYNYNFSNGSWASSITAGILANCSDQWEFAIHDSGHRVVSPFLFDGGSNHRLLMGRDIGWGPMYIEAASSFRAPIFYDSNNTSFYIDPTAGKSIRIAGGIAQNNIVGRPYAAWGASSSATGAVVIKFPGGTGNYGMIHAVVDVYEYSGNVTATIIVGGHNWNGAWYNYGVEVIGWTDKPVRLGVKDGKYCIVIGNGSSGWSYGQVVLRKIQNGTYYDGVMDVAEGYTAAIESDSYSWISGDLRSLRTPSSFTAGSAIYAPIYYDSNNTGYYIDPTSTTAIRTVGSWRADSSSWDGEFSGKMQYHSNHWYVQYADLFILRNSGGSNVWYANQSGTMYAPFWYDTNNTGYYVDPTGTSRISTIYCGDVYNDLGGWFRNYGATGIYNQSYGMHFYADSANYWNMGAGVNGQGIRFRDNYGSTVRGYLYYDNGPNVGFLNSGGSWRLRVVGDDYTLAEGSSIRGQLYYDSNNTGYYLDPASTSELNKVYYNSNMVSRNYGIGQVGLYASTRYQAVFSMGESYLLAADGTSVGNLYGIAWSHPNTGGAASNLASHGMLILENGSFQGAWGGGSLRTPSDVRGTIFYDWQNTGFFCDPNGRSRLSSIDYGDGGYYFGGGSWGWRHNTPYGYIEFGPANSSHAHIYTDRGNFYFNVDVMWANGNRMLSENQWINNKYFGSDGRIYSNVDIRSPIFYDQNDTGYYVDPNGTSNMWKPTSAMSERWLATWRALDDGNWRPNITGDSGYWTNTRGWGTNYGNWDNAWKYGFCGIDIWGGSTGHPQGSGYVHAQGINSGLHYANGDGSSAYGWQMVGAADAANRWWLRGKWGGTTRPWYELALYDNNSSGGSLYADYFYDRDTGYYVNGNGTSNLNYVTSRRYSFIGTGGDSGMGTEAYAIFQEGGSWSYPYPDLRIAYHTGIKLGGNAPSYEGTRVYSDYDMSDLCIQLAGGSNYSYKYKWMWTNGTGYYADINGLHLEPNQTSSYGSLTIRGNRSGWYGLMVYDGSGYRNHFMWETGNGGIYNQDTGRWILYHDRGGNSTGLGSSATSSSHRLYINDNSFIANMYANGFYYASDRKLKENIHTISNAVETVKKFRGVTYNKIDDKEKKLQIGLIAQEVEEIIPSLVTKTKDHNEVEYLSVNYGNIAGLLIEAVKEQSELINTLKTEIEQLKKKLGV